MSAIKCKMSRSADGMWDCTDCDYQTKYRTTLSRHIEAKHVISTGFSCPECEQFCPTRNSLMAHQYRKHDVRYTNLYTNS
jgi:hypothetical protein